VIGEFSDELLVKYPPQNFGLESLLNIFFTLEVTSPKLNKFPEKI
jgi:hypothetical protein